MRKLTLLPCRNPDVWGNDARIFRPERWLEQDASDVETPLGVYGNMRESPIAITPLWPLTDTQQAHIFCGCSELYRVEICVSHCGSSACRSLLKFSLPSCLPVSSSYKCL